MSRGRRTFLWSALNYLRSFLLFAASIGMAVTCTFLVFFSTVSLSEEEIRTFAPVVFVNVLVLAAICVGIDALRRYVTVKRPARKIQGVLERLMNGDFDARISVPEVRDRYSHFGEIAEHINALAGELAGVETLRTDFIANVSHELKTPLAVIQNYGTMLQQPGLTEEKRLEYARSVTDSARRLASLVTNILKLNKLENQQIFPAVSVYNLSEQLCESLLQFEPVWEKQGIEIDVNLAEGVRISADAELLSLVWNNLLSNAFKFTRQGGTVGVILTADSQYATVQISDTGCGMSPEVGAHIFEKFYQGDASHATQGNGLGLALVKRVVDIMGGEICVESAPGVGSTFTVKIRRNCHEGLEQDL